MKRPWNCVKRPWQILFFVQFLMSDLVYRLWYIMIWMFFCNEWTQFSHVKLTGLTGEAPWPKILIASHTSPPFQTSKNQKFYFLYKCQPWWSLNTLLIGYFLLNYSENHFSKMNIFKKIVIKLVIESQFLLFKPLQYKSRLIMNYSLWHHWS